MVDDVEEGLYCAFFFAVLDCLPIEGFVLEGLGEVLVVGAHGSVDNSEGDERDAFVTSELIVFAILLMELLVAVLERGIL